MSLTKRKNSPYWWCDITPATGKRVRESTGLTEKAEAQRYHDELKARLWSEAKDQPVATKWDDACIKWLKVEERGLTEKYIIKNIGRISRITPEAFDPILRDKKPATYNRHRSVILAIANLSGIKLDIPIKKVSGGRVRFLTGDEWQRLHSELPEHLQAIASFAIYTGLRQSNVTQLEWSQVDLKRKVCWIHPDQAKADKAIGIPLSDKACDILKSQLGKHERWVFTYRGSPVAKIKLAWHKACVRAGLGKFTETRKGQRYEGFVFHGLRHTWASWSIMAGTPIDVLRQLGGWADLKMVLRYTHLAPDHLRQYANNSVPWSVT